jgi:Glu-tRNA(Gln) amidotransferase subunit E-like FAD-binding protein
MGTSKSNYGPSGGVPLLPDWAVAPPNNKDKDTIPDLSNLPKPQPDQLKPTTDVWRPVRTSFSSYLKNPSPKKLNRTIKRYVIASGGSKGISRSVVAGRTTARKFGKFLSDIVVHGSDEAIKQLGILDFTGKSSEFVFAKLAEALSPDGNVLDDSYARSAISDTLSKIYEEFEIEGKSLDELDNLNTDQAKELMESFLASYIFERLISELGRTLINKDYSSKEVVEKEFEIEEYIMEEVKLELQDFDVTHIDFMTSKGDKLISKIFSNAYSIFEKL